MAVPVVTPPSRDEYIQQLTPYNTFVKTLENKGSPAEFQTVDISDLKNVGSLPGKTGAKIVTKRSSALPHSPRFVFKGMDFEQYKKDSKDFKEHQEKTLLREVRTLYTLPPHPNIMPSPQALVVIRDQDEKDRICGFLQPDMEKGSVDEQVIRANKQGRRLPLQLKAKWCYQMASAVQHTHQAAKSYHMDLKPGNILVDDEDNLRLIDWEQSGVSMFTHPPEVTIDQEAEESSIGSCNGKQRIIYTPHSGAPRKNQKWGFPDWNVFPEWKRTCPRAAELAEVFSLGRTMWMLLEQVEQSADVTVWTTVANDVSEEWKEMVMRCIERDPNDRPDLDEVVAFWEKQWRSSHQ
ncbi:Serine/threonine-protein kinase Nek6 [Colletotrichum chlorophyti]|uniref:Serine/threonine-protein kinase Nek6 n=1 Tax=Colletotrichum chlorophyti TaxID=708187 RepID=A0A1Q8RRK2_9PEZI|nr:Serine/threonine-protein kinase Nek6 [Colletotrichum chlorophyti]